MARKKQDDLSLPPEPVEDDEWEDYGSSRDGYGGSSYTPGGYGQSYTEPAWRQPPPAASAVSGAVQWMVKQLVNGRPAELGHIGIRATIDDIIERWYAALCEGGTVQLYPVGMDGRIVHGHEDEPEILDISPAHEAIARVRRKKQIAGAVGPLGPSMAAGGVDAVALVQTLSAQHQAQLAALQAQISEANRRAEDAISRAQELIHETTSERISMSLTQQGDQHAMYEAMAARDAERADRMLATLTTILEQTRSTEQQRHELQLERERKAREEEEDRAERRRREDEARWERQRKLDDEFRRAREKEINAEREARMAREAAAHERELQASREHHQNTLKLLEAQNQANDPIAQATKLFGTASAAAAAAGLDIKDLVTKALGGGGGTLPELAVGVIDKLADTAIKLKQLEDGGGDDGDDDEDPNEVIQVQDTNGRVHQMTRAQYNQIMAQQQQAQLPGPVSPPGVPGAPQGDDMAGDGFVYAHTGAQPQQPEQPQQAAPQHNGQQPQPSPAARASQLPPAVQKAGRKAARWVVDMVQQADEPARSQALLTALMQQQQALGPYVQAVGVTGALRETGAPDDFVAWCVQTIQSSGLLPASVPM